MKATTTTTDRNGTIAIERRFRHVSSGGTGRLVCYVANGKYTVMAFTASLFAASHGPERGDRTAARASWAKFQAAMKAAGYVLAK